jgi:hypothetical protein
LKIAIVDSGVARSTGRLDPKHLLAIREAPPPPVGRAIRTLGNLGRLTQPSRFKRVYATAEEERIPYLRPYDIFDYLPGPADFLSKSRSLNLPQLMVSPGTILQTCSGRNLGPAVLVDEYLAGFAFSHDLIRIEIDDPQARLSTLAYLRTEEGRRAITIDKAGSVIDHLTPDQVASVAVPELDPGLAAEAARLVARAARLRSLARRRLRRLQAKVEAVVPMPVLAHPLRDGYQLSSTDMHARIDAAFYSPLVREIRGRLADAGAQRMAELADVRKPGGRYSPRYVDPEHGQPLLSGRQILQWYPIALKHVAARSFREVAPYQLSAGTIVYQADGRAEEGLGTPSVITVARDGWLASGHVGRLAAREGVPWGQIYLALASMQCQVQIRATASGSVVDSTFVEDMEQILTPPIPRAVARSAERAWRAIVAADELENRGTTTAQSAITSH